VTIFLTVLHVLVCVILVVVVLLQRGKGAEIGAVFGGGSSSTVFGARGAGNFFTRLTTGAAVLFMVTSLWLSVLGTSRVSEGLFDEEESAPADAQGEADGGFAETPQPAAGEESPTTPEPPPAVPEGAPAPAPQ
jgi:preprotein translocase subunit SecG